MPYKDKGKQREYQREWMRRRREEFIGLAVCELCGSSDRLEIHHVDPSQKVSHKIWSWSKDRIIDELSKCVVWCQVCHSKYHKPITEFCGTLTAYQRGCRCSKCKNARGRYAKLERKAAKLGKTPATM